MKGTKNDNDWRFYHDALTLMTSADLIDYMKAKAIYHRWILPPGQGLFEDDTALRNFRGRPPGDSPELMPWDNNLNQDAHVSVERHVGITSVYEKGDPRKFSKSTPNEGARAYKRVLHPTEGVAPTPKRIVQDCMLWLQALEEIRKSKGTLNDFAKRRGTRGEFSAEERAEMIRTGSRQRGGRREKGSGFRKCLVLHHDAKPAAKIKIEEASKTCEQQRLPGVDSETQVPIQHN
ncbi:unnamed protein product [Cylindrotheca closterium]|uniref:Uncharacterized protein n=1 Tax=Cylindrotheca closterium TaxID=2856 RepID=A0AAD2CRZ2_9STRA|nr:unnamed protein product [Cylindrotheca closterium]